MKGKHHLYIVEVGGSPYVTPDVTSVDLDKSKAITMRNMSNFDCAIEFQGSSPLAQGTRVDVPKKSKGKQVDLAGTASGFYTYKLSYRRAPQEPYIETKSGSAVPGDPGMIIDP